MAEKNQAVIHLYTVIQDQGDKETITEKHEGICMKSEEKTVLIYTDVNDEWGEVKNIITIQADRLSVKRSGAVSMHQIFLVGKRTECMYQHPYGRFLLDIETTFLDVKDHQVTIAYEMNFQGTNRHYNLTIEYTEVPE